MSEFNVPEHTMGAIRRYVDDGLYPGGFLTAVFENNLFQAIANADEYNREKLRDICIHIYNNEPNGCWGQKGIVEEWAVEVWKRKKAVSID